MKQLLLFVNPVSGTKKAGKSLAEIIGVFNQAEYDTRVFITTRQGDSARAVHSFGTISNTTSLVVENLHHRLRLVH